MSYQQKLEEVRALLVQHNSQLPNESGRVDVENFFSQLMTNGGTNDAALSQSSWEDLMGFGLPKLLARQVATIFRKEEKKTEEKPVLKKSKVEGMSLTELLNNYDPRNHTSHVNQRLSDLFFGKRFIVFNDNATVNVPASVKLGEELLDEYPERELFVLDGVPTKTYSVGMRPDQSYDENPIYPGRVLRPDGDCDQTNRSWSGVSLEVRQILYLAVKQTKEIVIDSINSAHNIMDIALKEDALKNVRLRYTKAAALLKELINQNKAPSLKIFKKAADSKSNNPFGSNKTY